MAGLHAGIIACLLAACAFAPCVGAAEPAAAAGPAPQSEAPAPQTSDPAQTATPAAAAPSKVAKDTVVDLEIDDHISSKTNKDGDLFHFHLVEPIVQDGKVVVPASVHGVGEVIHAARAGFGGTPGELIIAARYLDCSGVRLPLGHFRYGMTGHDNSDLTLAAVIAVGLPGLFITVGNVNVQPGTRAHARVTADVILPDPASPQTQVTQNGAPTQ